ncbi:MAG: FAD-dependent oxidoreductase [Planctomycetes bacterium]|nr:FAD-dependent oxidoreductase [Planctomycetota bacterium]
MMVANPRILIVGGGAAGRAAAARARRQNDLAEIMLIDRGLRFSASDASAIRSRLAIDVKTGSEVVALDPKAKKVRIVGVNGAESTESYDALVLATGTRPTSPSGTNAADSRSIAGADVRGKRVAILGCGFIALDASIRALSDSASDVRVFVPDSTFLPDFDDEMAALVERRLTAQNVVVVRGVGVPSVSSGRGQYPFRIVCNSGETHDAEVVVPALAVRADVQLATAAGVKLGSTGAIAVGRRMETNVADVYAAGACAESPNAILMYEATWEPSLGSAVRSGHVAGANAAGATNDTFDGVLATRISRGAGLEVGSLGLTERDAVDRHFDVVIAHALPRPIGGGSANEARLVVKLVLDKMSGWILGVQAVGTSSISHVIDVFATAIVGGMAIDKVAQLDLAAFGKGPSWSPASESARVGENAQRGFVDTVSAVALRRELSEHSKQPPIIIDVRASAHRGRPRIATAVSIPLDELRSRIDEIAVDRPVIVCSETGRSAYVAARILSQRNREVRILSGGMTCWPFEVATD